MKSSPSHSFDRFRSKPRPAAYIPAITVEPTNTLPILVRPQRGDIDLNGWIREHRQEVEDLLKTYPALLFRGFGPLTASQFEEFALLVCGNLYKEYGDLPREKAGKNIYQATPYPPDKPILLHNEASHTHSWPQYILFYCQQPADQGGETSLADGLAIYHDLSPVIRERFEALHLLYVRNFIPGLDSSWQQFFRTSDRHAVEEYCRRTNTLYEWREPDELKTSRIGPAILRHPTLNVNVWFNQIQLHHIACLDQATRQGLLSLYGKDRLPRCVYFSDGSPIEDEIMAEVGGVLQRHTTTIRLEATDLLLLDNLRVAHRREPYVGQRQILVAMGMVMTDVRATGEM